MREKKPSNCLGHWFRANLPEHVLDVAWSADGSQVIAGLSDGAVFVYSAASASVHLELQCHAKGLGAIAVHPKEPLLATAGHDSKIGVWSLTTGQKLHEWEGGAAWVERLAWNSTGTILASAAGKVVRMWNIGSQEILLECAELSNTVADLAWKPGHDVLAVAVYGGVNLYSSKSVVPIAKWPYKGSPLRLAWSPDGKMLVHGNQDSSVHFRYADSGAELHMSGYPTKVRELSWDFRGRYLATGGGPGACIWDCSGAGPEGREPRILEGHAGDLSAVAWQRRGFLLATADVAGKLCVWQTANRTPLVGVASFSDTEVSCLEWAPNDKAIAVGTAAGALAVFKVE